jgi:hypothetical protein
MSVFPHILCNPEDSTACSKLTNKRVVSSCKIKIGFEYIYTKIQYFNIRASEVGIRMVIRSNVLEMKVK